LKDVIYLKKKRQPLKRGLPQFYFKWRQTNFIYHCRPLELFAFYSRRLQLFHYTKLPTAGWLLANSANERNNGRPHRAGKGPIVTRSREHGITFWSEGVKQLSVPHCETI
jgi:hypothetical protein